ncbi:MAG: hypothetical protein WKG01_05300 [Kofleriaceae bacterium]
MRTSQANWKGIAWELSAQFPTATYYPKLARILRPLVDALFIRDELKWIGRSGGKLVETTSAELGKAIADRAQHRSWYLASSRDFSPAVSLTCHRLDEQMTVGIMLLGKAWKHHAPTLATTFEELTWSWIDAIGSEPRYMGGVSPSFNPPLNIPKALTALRPATPSNDVVDLLDRRNLEHQRDAEWTAKYKQVLDGALPKTVRVTQRENDGDRFAQRFWTEDLGDEKALRAACKRRQQWLVKTLTTAGAR